MSKKRLIVFGGLLVASFGASYVVSSLLTDAPPSGDTSGKSAKQVADQQAGDSSALLKDDGKPVVLSADQNMANALVKELRDRISQVRQKQRQLDDREERLGITQKMIAGEIQKLEDLRVALVGPLEGLKRYQEEIERGRVLIEREEATNIQRTAGIYTTMPAEAAAKIFDGMCDPSLNRSEDAAKILHYMDERNAAKAIAAMKPENATVVTDAMKRIRQKG